MRAAMEGCSISLEPDRSAGVVIVPIPPGGAVAYGDLNESNKRLIRFGVIGALCVLVVGGALVVFDRPNTSMPATGTASPAAPAAPQQAASAGDPVVPPPVQSDQVRGFIADARRQAAAGAFTEAQASLRKADEVVANLPETAQARIDIAALATPQGQLATQLTRARLAIDQGDATAAEKALAEAERLDPQAPEIAGLRAALQAAQQKETSRNNRITALLTKMREAIARHDLTTADGALNEAARIDIQDPSVQQARIELNRAQNQKTETENKDQGANTVSPTQILGGVRR